MAQLFVLIILIAVVVKACSNDTPANTAPRASTDNTSIVEVVTPPSRIDTAGEMERAKRISDDMHAKGIGITPAQALGLMRTEKELCGNSSDCN